MKNRINTNNIVKKIFISLFYAICIVMFISSAACSNRELGDDTVALVGKENISHEEMFYYFNKYGNSAEEFKGESGSRRMLEKLIDFKLMLATAKKYAEDKNIVFINLYGSYIRKKYAELYRTELAKKIKVSDEEVQVVFVESDTSGKRLKKEEIDKRKNEIRMAMYEERFKDLIQNELENLKKDNIIKVYSDVIDDIDRGDVVKDDTILLVLGDEKIDYKGVRALFPPTSGHSSPEMLRKKVFINSVINKEIEAYLFSKTAKEKGIEKNNPHFTWSNKEYYEKTLVSMLDYNEGFKSDLFGMIKVSDDEIKKYYDDNKQKMKEYDLLLKVKKLSFTSLTDAEKAVKNLSEGETIDSVAKKYMEKLNTKKYDLGFLSKLELKDVHGLAVYEEAIKLKVNQVSDILLVDDAYIVFLIEDEMKNTVLPLESIKDVISGIVRGGKSEEVMKSFINDLRASTEIKINEPLLIKMSK